VPERFLGKFRGTAVDTRDPLLQGRVQVLVPEVLGDNPSWALPCVPYAGPGVGLLAPPPQGGNVWVEFEAGSPERPIWVGCFWGRGELPARAPDAGGIVVRLGEVTLVTVDARPGGPPPLPPAAAGAETTEVTVTRGGLVVSRGGRPVLTVERDSVTVELAPLRIDLSGPRGTLSLASGDTTATVAADAVELVQAGSKARVAADGVALTSGGAAAKVTPSTVELTSGAAKVTLTPAMVSVNEGALEVT
jgi:hypothetical protein